METDETPGVISIGPIMDSDTPPDQRGVVEFGPDVKLVDEDELWEI
jgi:hypothetical protein